MGRVGVKPDLANDSIVAASDLGVTPRDEVEIDDRDKIVFEELDQIIHYEVSAERAKGFVVKF